ncbi:MAG TPA: DNA repair protein RecO, partial [Ruminococcaceae bacterium]|nr:DNA repair protein RecO [Oscillospiraceae bacterium]
KESMCFDAEGGGLICEDCGDLADKKLLPKGVLAAMRHILSAQAKKLFSFTLPRETLERLALVCEDYTLLQTGRAFKSLEFYKEIRRNI